MLSLSNFCTKENTAPVETESTGKIKYDRRKIEDAVIVLQTQPKGRATDQAMSTLIKQFYNFIAKNALKIDPMNYDDKFIAGCEGLLYAARNFNFEEDTQFFTYAHNCITGYMHQDTRDGRLIHITSTSLRKLKQPGNEKMYTYAMNPISLNNAAYDSDGTDDSDELEEYIADDSLPDTIETIYNDKTEQLLRDIIYENDRTANGDVSYADLYCRYKGLFGNPKTSITMCAQDYDIDPDDLKRNFTRIRRHIKNNLELRSHLNITSMKSKKQGISAVVTEVPLGRREQLIRSREEEKARKRREKEEFDLKYVYNKKKQRLEFNFEFD